MSQAYRKLPAVAALLVIALAFAPRASADPGLTNEGGLQRATWDFANTSDYVTMNTTLAVGDATLATTPSWRNYTTDAEFVAAKASSTNVVAQTGLRLMTNGTNLLADGTFDLAPGPWTYTNGSTGQVTAIREPGARARLSHTSPNSQFDAMDDALTSQPWTADSAGPGWSSAISQETAIRREGTGSLRDVLTIGGGGSGNYAGVYRDDPGTWNWSAYNRLAIWIEGTGAAGVGVYVFLDNLGGTNFASFVPHSLSPGWNRYLFDLSPYSGGNEMINRVLVRFFGPAGTSTVYLDDLVLFNYTAFDEETTLSQTFIKPSPTSGNAGNVALRFDVDATPSVNVVSYLKVRVGGFFWYESPVSTGPRSMYLDLSGDSALQGNGTFTLVLSLQLIRYGTEEASMAAWIDNVTLTAGDYLNGSFTAVPIDMGSSAMWTLGILDASRPPGTSVALETRTGNSSSPGDPTWNGWRPANGFAIGSLPERFLQWRLSLTTVDGNDTPIVSRVSIRAEMFASNGTVRTLLFLPPEALIGWRWFQAREVRPPGTTVVYDLSVDNASTWVRVVDGQNLNAMATNPAIVRASLSTTNASRSPSLTSFALLYESLGTPRINGIIPDLVGDEDSGPWTWDLMSFARPQPDANDTLDNLRWIVSGADPNLITISGAGTFGVHRLVVLLKPDAFGSDAVRLFLEDRDGKRTSQDLNVTVRPVDDPPTFVAWPGDLYMRAGEPYRFEWLPYVRDVDTAVAQLSLTTEDPAHIAIDGLNATYAYDASFLGQTVFVRHQVSDGLLSSEIPIGIHVTNNPPPQTVKPLPDLTFPEDTVLRDAFAPDSLRAFFTDPEGQQLFLSYNFTHLAVEIWDDGSKLRVNVTAEKDFCGADRITFRATDPLGAFGEYTIRVSVLCVNDPPVLTWSDDVRVRFDTPYPLDLAPFVSDVDNPRQDLVLSTSDPAAVTVDGLAVSILYTRARLGNASTYVIALDLSLADRASSVSRRIDVIVSDNRPPELLRPLGDIEFDEDTTRQLDLATYFWDYEDGAVLAYGGEAQNVAVAFNGTQVTLTPPRDWSGPDVAVLRATDSQGSFAVGYLAVQVLPVDDAPRLAPLPAQTRQGGGSWVVDLRSYASDVDDDLSKLTFTVSGSPRARTFGFLLSLDYPDADTSEQLVVTVQDSSGLKAETSVSIRVIGPSIWSAVLSPWTALVIVAFVVAGFVVWKRYPWRVSPEDLFLIADDGRLLIHSPDRPRGEMDDDILAGMLTAVTMFIRDTFKDEAEGLKRFEVGNRNAAVDRGKHVYLAAIYGGALPVDAHRNLKAFLVDLEARYGEKLGSWSFLEDFPGLKETIERFGRQGRWRVGDIQETAKETIAA